MNLFRNNNNKNSIKTHLSYCGYDIESTESGNLLCKKEYCPSTFIGISQNEIYIMGSYPINELAQNNMHSLLEYVNELNKNACIANFIFNKETNMVEFRALYFGRYSKNDFSQFIKYCEKSSKK